ncbi:MAG: ComF family protein [Coriobacteriia bacterium]
MRGLCDLLFPPRCAGCDRPGALLCPQCAARIERIDPRNACAACGAPGAPPCPECGGRRFGFGEARCASLLRPPVSRAIVLLKDGCERRYAEFLAQLLAEVCDGWLRSDDVLVPVPASPAAVRRRGFDHALDVARALARETGVPLARALSGRPTEEQRVLGRDERFANRAHAFALACPQTTPRRAVLVDDVFTTGATLDAAARVLISGGCLDVRAVAAARSCSRHSDEVNNGPPPATLHMLSPGSVVADAPAS